MVKFLGTYAEFHFVKTTVVHIFLMFHSAAIESIDIPRILSQQGGEAVYPLPRIRTIEVHSKLNLAVLLFAVK